MKQKVIFFDLGYTLLYLNREQPFQRLLEKRGYYLDLEEVEIAFHLTDKLFMREFPGVLAKTPESYIPWYHARMLHQFNIHTDLCGLFADWRKEMNDPLESWRPYPYVQEVLAGLQERGYRLGVISNWDHTARKILDKHGLSGYFETLVISSECGWEKPSRKIFLRSMEEMSARPGDCLYIGDNYYDDYVGSRNAEMECYIVNRFGTSGIEELPECTIIPDIRALLDEDSVFPAGSSSFLTEKSS